ncbi:MAG: ABC transporter permease [Gemmatimonadetes bacterium]|nr:ABC transporter permease [Gemmatimonadota bacterium]
MSRARRAWRAFPPPARVGLVGLVAIVLVAILGPLFAPYPPATSVGPPFAPPSAEFLLGTDNIGQDVLSRVLSGGASVLILAGLATLLAYAIGIPLGLFAGYNRGLAGGIVMRGVDVLLAIPALLLLLVLATGAGAGATILVVGIALVHVPQITRIVRAATLQTTGRAFIEAAEARGDSTARILGVEILPNISGPLLADVGVRFTGSVLLVAAVNFLGLGVQPPAVDWALMISENRSGISIQPWAVVAPAALLAALAVAVNSVADGIARIYGRSSASGEEAPA